MLGVQAPPFPICIVFLAGRADASSWPQEFRDLVVNMRGVTAFAILDVQSQQAVGMAMLNAMAGGAQVRPDRDAAVAQPLLSAAGLCGAQSALEALPVWKLYHKGMHCAEASGWPTAFSLNKLLQQVSATQPPNPLAS